MNNNEFFKYTMKKIVSDNFDEFNCDIKKPNEKHRKLALQEIKDNFMECAASIFENDKKAKFTYRKRFLKYIPITIIALFCFILGGLFFSDVPLVQAIKRNTSQYFQRISIPNSSFEEKNNSVITSHWDNEKSLEEHLGYTIPKTTWIPNGYDRLEITTQEGSLIDTLIFYDYVNVNKDPIRQINIAIKPSKESGTQKILSLFDDVEYTTLIINNIEVVISDTEPVHAALTYNGTYDIEIVANCSQEDVLKIIESISK